MSNKLENHISLAHGNGGRFMRNLIDEIFLKNFSTDPSQVQKDAVHIPTPAGKIMVTTDGFTVKPLEFPGGNIGSLAIHGTLNDLAVAGAKPMYLTLSVFVEEGFSTNSLRRIIESMGQNATQNNVTIVAGDTKVLPRGEANGLYFSMTGIGTCEPQLELDMKNIQAGDSILVSGPVGDHGIAVMLAREEFGLKGNIQSDSASVIPLAEAIYPVDGLRFMRDPTRGGIATVMHEISQGVQHSIKLNETQIPVRDEVRSVCSMLGYDPLYLACEGRIVAVVDSRVAEKVLAIWKSLPNGHDASMVGRVLHETYAEVILKTELGGERFLEELEDDPLPRIC